MMIICYNCSKKVDKYSIDISNFCKCASPTLLIFKGKRNDHKVYKLRK